MTNNPVQLFPNLSYSSIRKFTGEVILVTACLLVPASLGATLNVFLAKDESLRDPRFSSGHLEEMIQLEYSSEYHRYTAGQDINGDDWSLYSITPGSIRYVSNNKLHSISKDPYEMNQIYGQKEYFSLALSSRDTCPDGFQSSISIEAIMNLGLSQDNKYCLYLSRDVRDMSHEDASQYWIKMKDNIRKGLSNAHDVVSEHANFNR